jgi:abortive infection bacteriophage resistance protein
LVGGIVFLTRPVLRLVRGGGLVLFNENSASFYQKTHLSIPQQIDLLSSRGMRIADFEYATKALASFGYYRLSGYWYPYRTADGANEYFVHGIAFEEVIALYEFDRKLRFVVFDAIERLEVALRFEIAHAIGETGAFNHRIGDIFTPEFSRPGSDGKSKLDVLLGKMDRESNRSSETFTKHHFHKYGRPLPIWKVVEVINFSQLCELYSGLKQKDQDLIASRFGIRTRSGNGDSGTLSNWMANLNHVRNICAHHSRLWNRNIDVQISPKKLIQ